MHIVIIPTKECAFGCTGHNGNLEVTVYIHTAQRAAVGGQWGPNGKFLPPGGKKLSGVYWLISSMCQRFSSQFEICF